MKKFLTVIFFLSICLEVYCQPPIPPIPQETDWVESNGFLLKTQASVTTEYSGVDFSYTIFYTIPPNVDPNTTITITDVIPLPLLIDPGPFTIIPVGSNIVTYTVPNSNKVQGTYNFQINVHFPVGTTCNGTSATNNSCMQTVGTGVLITPSGICTAPLTVTAVAAENPYSIYKAAALPYTGSGSSLLYHGAVDNEIEYSISLYKSGIYYSSNNGQQDLSNLIVTDVFPANAEYVTGSLALIFQNGAATYVPTPVVPVITANSTTISFIIQSLPIADGTILMFTYRIKYPAAFFSPGDIESNTASFSALSCGNTVYSDPSTVNVELEAPSPGGSIGKEVHLINPVPGCNGFYRLLVTNTGSMNLPSSTIVDNIPDEVDVTSIAFNTANYNNNPLSGTLYITGTVNSSTTTVSILFSGNDIWPSIAYPNIFTEITNIQVDLGSGLPTTKIYGIDIFFTVATNPLPTVGTIVSNTMDITYDQNSGLPPSSSSVPFTIENYQPKICVAKFVCNEKSSYLFGDMVRYKLRIQNIGSGSLTGATITDILDQNLEYDPAIANPIYYSSTDPAISCAPGGANPFTFVQTGQTLEWVLPPLEPNCQLYNWYYGCDVAGVPYFFIEFSAIVKQHALAGSVANSFTVSGGGLAAPQTSAPRYITVNSVFGAQAEKFISVDNGISWGKSVTAAPGSEVLYRLWYKNTSNYPVRDIVVVDMLPMDRMNEDVMILNRNNNNRGSQFDLKYSTLLNSTPWPLLQKLETNPLNYSIASADIKVNDDYDICLPELGYEPAGCSPTTPFGSWVSSGSFRNVKFDFGAAFELKPNDELTCDFKVQLPYGIPSGQFACNSFALNSTGYYYIIQPNGPPIPQIVHPLPTESDIACITTSVSDTCPQACENFDDSTSNFLMNNNGITSTDDLVIQTPGSGGYAGDKGLKVTGKSGETWIYNTIDYSGNYLACLNNCLCWDINMLQNETDYYPFILLFRGFNTSAPFGPTNPEYLVRYTSDNLTGLNVWEHTCAPIKPSPDGNDPPLSQDGIWTWNNFPGSNPPNWNDFISAIEGVMFRVDVTGWAGNEIFILDSICLSPCDTVACDTCIVGSISADQTICVNTIPAQLIGTPPSNGTTPTYQWQSSINNSFQNILGATMLNYQPGPLSVTTSYRQLQNAVGTCGGPLPTNTVIITVIPILTVSVSITPSGNPVCAGTPVTFTATPVNGGVTPTYQWNVNGADVPGATNATYSFIPENNDQIECVLTSNATCTTGNPATATISAATYPEVLISPVSVINISCYGGDNGAISIVAGGGASPFSYLWSNGAAIQDISGLTAGAYSVTVTDANGCSDDDAFTITEPPALFVTSSATNITCHGGTSTVTMTAGGGTYPYVIGYGLLSPDPYPCAGNNCLYGCDEFNVCYPAPNAFSSPVNLTAGAYAIVVTDANGCTAYSTITITEPEELTISLSTTNISCYGGNNGSATITPFGGILPLSYLWSNGAAIQNISGLTAASYSVTVTDANGCSADDSFTITEPPALFVTSSATNIPCHGGTSTVTMTAGGGTYPYVIGYGLLSPDPYPCAGNNCLYGCDEFNVCYPAPNAYSSPVNLIAGAYAIVVTDANGCIAYSTITITEPAELTISLSTTIISCFGGNNGSVTITPSGGTLPYSYLWSNGATIQNISGLTAGTYTVTVTDANGCAQTGSEVVIANPPIFPIITGAASVCALSAGNVYQTEAGMTGYVWSVSAGGMIAGGVGTNTLTVTWNNAGAQTVSVNYIDLNGCSAASPTVFTVNVFPVFMAGTISHDQTIIYNTIPAALTGIPPNGGSIPYTYKWQYSNDNLTFMDIPGATNLNYQPGTLVATTYYRSIQTSAHGCGSLNTNIVTITVNALVPSQLSLTNITVGSGQIVCYNATQTITLAGGGTTFIVEPAGSVTLIAGEIILFLPGTRVQNGGHLHGYIAPSGPFCNPVKIAEVGNLPDTDFTEGPISLSNEKFFKIYPNPTVGSFSLELNGLDETAGIKVEIYGMLGERLLSKNLQGQRRYEFSLDGKPNGVYFIRVVSGKFAGNGKIIKQ